MNEILAWKPFEHNEVLEGEGFYISYNHNTQDELRLTQIMNAFGQDVKDGEETALKGADGIWYILEGDFRKEYAQAFPNGFEACLAVYTKNIAHRSNWSTDESPITREQNEV